MESAKEPQGANECPIHVGILLITIFAPSVREATSGWREQPEEEPDTEYSLPIRQDREASYNRWLAQMVQPDVSLEEVVLAFPEGFGEPSNPLVTDLPSHPSLPTVANHPIQLPLEPLPHTQLDPYDEWIPSPRNPGSPTASPPSSRQGSPGSSGVAEGSLNSFPGDQRTDPNHSKAVLSLFEDESDQDRSMVTFLVKEDPKGKPKGSKSKPKLTKKLPIKPKEKLQKQLPIIQAENTKGPPSTASSPVVEPPQLPNEGGVEQPTKPSKNIKPSNAEQVIMCMKKAFLDVIGGDHYKLEMQAGTPISVKCLNRNETEVSIKGSTCSLETELRNRPGSRSGYNISSNGLPNITIQGVQPPLMGF